MDEAFRLDITDAISVAFVVNAVEVVADARLLIVVTIFFPRSLALLLCPARCTMAASGPLFERLEGRPLEITEETSFAASEPRPRPNPVAAPSTVSLKDEVLAAINWSEETWEPTPDINPTASPSAIFAMSTFPPNPDNEDNNPLDEVEFADVVELVVVDLEENDLMTFVRVPFVRNDEVSPDAKFCVIPATPDGDAANAKVSWNPRPTAVP